MPDRELAPGRGRYDRSLPASARDRYARRRLISAVIECCDSCEPVTVARICARSGCGRNTFYAHFADIAHAERAARAYAGEELQAAIERAREPPTPLERIRASVFAWAQRLLADATLARFALRASEEGTSVAGEVLRARLGRLAVAAAGEGALPAGGEAARVVIAVAAVEALCRIEVRSGGRDGSAGARAADVVLKNLR